jgi:hypothetical protein
LPISCEIVLDATALPDGFRSDPADELIVATARVLGLPLLTADQKLLDYPHVTRGFSDAAHFSVSATAKTTLGEAGSPPLLKFGHVRDVSHERPSQVGLL